MSGKITIIAEAGVNHNGDIDKAFELVKVAKKSGADYVKFQTFSADKLAVTNLPQAEYQKKHYLQSSQYEMLRKLQLSCEQHFEVKTLCQSLDIGFLSTAFDIDSLNFLTNSLGITMVKIASGEITNAPFLLASARTELPILMSTGMATIEEIQQALSVIAFGFCASDRDSPTREALKDAWENQQAQIKLNENVTLLHCVSEYPTLPENANLRAIALLKENFGLNVGYSDHTLGISLGIASAALGATVIEKHFTLDKALPGPDHQASLTPQELSAFVSGVREIELGLGHGKKLPTQQELQTAKLVRKRIVASKRIKRGDTFSINNITCMRASGGHSAMQYWELLGKIATNDYQYNQPINDTE